VIAITRTKLVKRMDIMFSSFDKEMKDKKERTTVPE
jgi:hypothetical protein